VSSTVVAYLEGITRIDDVAGALSFGGGGKVSGGVLKRRRVLIKNKLKHRRAEGMILALEWLASIDSCGCFG
jgi:hypothetical protein